MIIEDQILTMELLNKCLCTFNEKDSRIACIFINFKKW